MIGPNSLEVRSFFPAATLDGHHLIGGGRWFPTGARDVLQVAGRCGRQARHQAPQDVPLRGGARLALALLEELSGPPGGERAAPLAPVYAMRRLKDMGLMTSVTDGPPADALL